MKSFLINIIAFFLLISCSDKPNKADDNTAFTRSDNPESLEHWTSDTILKTNYQLVQLMDTLYQFVRSDTIPPESLEREITWMANYRQQLCRYFDSKYPSTDNIPPFVKADSVIAEARTLWSINKDNSTMGMIINNDIERTRLMFEQFNEYEKLLSICKTETQKDLLYNEFVEWFKLEGIFSNIFANCVDLCFWEGGTDAGPKRTNGYLRIWQSHIELYQTEYMIKESYDDGLKDNGTFLTPARDLIMSCCKQALTEYYYLDETDETDQRYKELYEETQKLIHNLPQYIDSWINARKQWEEEISNNFWRPRYSRNTSEVLIKLANIISSI